MQMSALMLSRLYVLYITLCFLCDILLYHLSTYNGYIVHVWCNALVFVDLHQRHHHDSPCIKSTTTSGKQTTHHIISHMVYCCVKNHPVLPICQSILQSIPCQMAPYSRLIFSKVCLSLMLTQHGHIAKRVSDRKWHNKILYNLFFRCTFFMPLFRCYRPRVLTMTGLGFQKSN